jgi:citrate lyase beta subunit
MRYIQCFPLYKPDALKRLIHQACNNRAEILLDLEDSMLNVNDAVQTNNLKCVARESLSELGDFLGILSHSHPLHIRINNPATAYYAQDISVLAGLKNIRWQSIFVPKTETIDELNEVYAELKNRNIWFLSLSPIIETRIGLEMMMTKFKNAGPLFQTVYFGNYDYNLSANNWPLIEQHNNKYWQMVKPLIKKIEQLGYHYGNSPYANLTDKETLRLVLNNLALHCRRSFCQVTLNAEQSKFCLGYNKNRKMSPSLLPVQQNDRINIPRDFSRHKLPNRSFAFIGSLGRIITPQEYLLSLNQNLIQ